MRNISFYFHRWRSVCHLIKFIKTERMKQGWATFFSFGWSDSSRVMLWCQIIKIKMKNIVWRVGRPGVRCVGIQQSPAVLWIHWATDNGNQCRQTLSLSLSLSLVVFLTVGGVTVVGTPLSTHTLQLRQKHGLTFFWTVHLTLYGNMDSFPY